MGEKNRYSDEELKEFEDLILKKLRVAREDRDSYKKELASEENKRSLSKEDLNKLVERYINYIFKLELALLRIKKKTYGICRETGKLISKERLRSVPHATLSIDVKMCSN